MELHDQPVRASSDVSITFTLLKASSFRFGSYPYYIVALLTLGFPTAPARAALAKQYR